MLAATRAVRRTAARARHLGTASAAAAVTSQNVTTGSDGWPPGLFVFDGFGSPSPETARGVVTGAQAVIGAVGESLLGTAPGLARNTAIPQPKQGRISQAHNLAEERSFIPLKVPDPTAATAGKVRQCEHFAAYGSKHHALTYFRGNHNIPSFMDPILAALNELDVVRALQTEAKRDLHWKLTLNNYQARDGGDDSVALAEAGGALFPWHTDLAANGDITAISTLLAPAIIEFAPHADLCEDQIPTTIVARPGSLVLLSGAARWDWVHRALPHPDAAGKRRISLVLGCGKKAF